MKINISTPMIALILGIVGSFGVNFAQIQVNASDIENTEKTYTYIQEQLTDIQKYLRANNKHEHDEENED